MPVREAPCAVIAICSHCDVGPWRTSSCRHEIMPRSPQRRPAQPRGQARRRGRWAGSTARTPRSGPGPVRRARAWCGAGPRRARLRLRCSGLASGSRRTPFSLAERLSQSRVWDGFPVPRRLGSEFVPRRDECLHLTVQECPPTVTPFYVSLSRNRAATRNRGYSDCLVTGRHCVSARQLPMVSLVAIQAIPITVSGESK